MFLKTYNIEFDEIIITFTDQNGSPLEEEHKLNLTLLTNTKKCDNILQNQDQEKMLNATDFYHLQENIKNSH